MKKKLILFDFDGTIVDTSPGIIKTVEYTLDYYGIKNHDIEILKKFIGPPLVSSFMNYYAFDREKAEEAVIVYRTKYKEDGLLDGVLYHGVRGCIDELHKEGYIVSIASSKPEHFCTTILEHFGVLDLFDDVVGATADGRISTKEQVLNEVFRRFSDISKDEMCLIGDTIYDVEGANKVGIDSVGVSFGFGNIKEMQDNGALAICNSMSEIPGTIRRLFVNE